MALVSQEGLQIWHGDREVTRTVHRITWNAEQMNKGGYDHYMLKEIYEQPQAIRDTMADYSAHARGESPLEQILPSRDPDMVLLVGCGTSYHSALLGEQVLSRLLTVPVVARVASEFRGGASQAQHRMLAIAFSQSGETTDTIAALRSINSAGYASLAVTNVMGSSISRTANATLYTRAGPEVAVASTKTFVSQVAAAYCLGYDLAADGGGTDGIPEHLRALPGKLQQVLSNGKNIERVATQLAHRHHMFIVAKGLDVPIAMEGALKFKEVAYLPTEGYPAGELKHGPFALLDQDTPVIAIVSPDENRTRVLTTIKEIKCRGSTVIAIAARDDGEVAEFADAVITVPKADPMVAPLLHAVVLQLLSYHCARERGCPIDRPRNLAKSVTVP